jgi:hypothetical protein
MTKLPEFVPAAVAQFYWELQDGTYEYRQDEKDCQRRLVTDLRMKTVYEALRLSDPGWRLFFDVAWNHVFLEYGALRERRRRAYELYDEIATLAEKLAVRLESLEGALAGLAQPRGFNVEPGAMLDLLSLLDETCKDRRSVYESAIRPLLYKLPEHTRSAGLPTTAELVDRISQLAGEMVQLRVAGQLLFGARSGDGELTSGDPVLDRGIGRMGKRHSQLTTYLNSVVAGLAMHDETTNAANQLSDAAFAALAAVALNWDANSDSSEAVKKLRQRRDKAHKKTL